jgi:ABC-2 type transport system permease protein
VSAFVGTGRLVRLILRRDRVLMPLWVVFCGLVPVGLAASIAGLFPTAAGRARYADTSMGNAAFTTLYGRLSGSSLGELAAWRSGFVPVIVGLASLLTVIRHTRAEEEAGRRDLLGAAVVGRHAGLAAALLTTLCANLVLGAILALGMAGRGLPVAGSLAFGLELAAAGWICAAVGGLAAQLTLASGSARGIAVVVLGAAFLLRVVGDVSGQGGGAVSWLSWCSPIGWVQRIRPYHQERWWVLALAAGLSAALAAAAVAVSARRDVGNGVFAPRLGPAAAAAGLRSPLALAWRLHRGLLAGWTVGFAVLGVVLGGVAESVGDLLNDNPDLRDAFVRVGGRAGVVDSYLVAVMDICGLIAAAYAIQAALRLRAQEAGGLGEPVLATAVGRLRWAASHLVFALLGPAVALAAAGLGAGLTHGLNTGQVGREVPRELGGALIQLPAVWVLAAITVALVGLLPRLSGAGWVALAACLLIGLIGAAMQLDQRLLDLSPFTHLPRVPGATVSATPLVWLVVVAAGCAAVGLVGLRRRDIPAG